MSRGDSCARRLLLIVFVLFAFVCTQSASLNAEHETHHASEHCCALCHLGPAPILPASPSAIAAPAFSPIWLPLPDLVWAPQPLLAASSASRAPPA